MLSRREHAVLSTPGSRSQIVTKVLCLFGGSELRWGLEKGADFAVFTQKRTPLLYGYGFHMMQPLKKTTVGPVTVHPTNNQTQQVN